MEDDIYRKLIETDMLYQRWNREMGEDILEQFVRKFEAPIFADEPANVLAYVSSSWAVDRTYDAEPEEVDIEEFEKILTGG